MRNTGLRYINWAPHDKLQYCMNKCRASSDTEGCGKSESQRVELGEKCIKIIE